MTEKERNQRDLEKLKNLLLLFCEKDKNNSIFGISADEIKALEYPKSKPKKIKHIRQLEIEYQTEVEDYEILESQYLADNFDEFKKWSEKFERRYDEIDIFNFYPSRKKFKKEYMKKHNLTSDSQLDLYI